VSTQLKATIGGSPGAAVVSFHMVNRKEEVAQEGMGLASSAQVAVLHVERANIPLGYS
jgi:hypothetical protein